MGTMKIFVFLSVLSLVYSAPAPQEDAVEALPYIHEEIEALPYEHEATGDVAEAYVHQEIEALPYVHEEMPYEHEEPEPAAAAALPVIPQPVLSYAFAPLAVTNYAALPKAAEAAEGVKVALVSPYHLLAGYKTGCVNSVGSVVPCAL